MAIRQLVTAEELWQMPEVPGVRFELVDGELIAVPGAGGQHGLIAKRLLKLMDAAAEAADSGTVFGDGVTYILRRHPDLLRIPDASFISWGRLPNREVPEGYIEVPPDLAGEVVSPHDRADDVHDKVHEYLEAGTRLVWVCWTRRRMVTVHEADRPILELSPDDYLDGGDVLPGFRVRVGMIFGIA